MDFPELVTERAECAAHTADAQNTCPRYVQLTLVSADTMHARTCLPSTPEHSPCMGGWEHVLVNVRLRLCYERVSLSASVGALTGEVAPVAGVEAW